IDVLLARETQMPVHIAKDPLSCVARGTGMALEHYDLLQRVLLTSRKLAH
ncbi:MAG UNVERIFIED_CONTAM: rod shape-determining protein, partial [Thermobifida fusca]